MKNYFKKNIDSYSYLFFASVTAIAYKGYFKNILEHPDQLSPFIPYAFWQILCPSVIIIWFLIGSFKMYEIKSKRFNRIFAWFIHLMIGIFLIAFSPLG